jgi:hypothetical protein
MSNFTRTRPGGTELYHVGRLTDTTNETVTFHNFANAPKKWLPLDFKFSQL